ncbi:apolipoprotein N-acyltransferase [Marivirga sericea]|uniref:Apolipoprotein N-acyltransferase n=1 Tax=Marivirga sericea TaxID=1028 RepID=A0A1X7I8U2_9BACT|nr:apolipoprotein N-acyltransferase [Marivirga sericea]SMG10343.1 apolipoprotein N-acyltransferase [Marivirga sericea]
MSKYPSKITYSLLPLLSALLLAISWLYYDLLVFIALLPLFYFLKKCANKSEKSIVVFSMLYLTYILFNAISSFWIVNANTNGFLGIVVLNSVVLALPWIIYWFYLKSRNSKYSFLVLILSWLSVEFLHNKWDLGFPMYSLGNFLNDTIEIIQFYEFTGLRGGTLLILITNYVIFLGLTSYKQYKAYIISFTLILLSLFSWSIYRFQSYEEKENPISVAVLHTFADVYTFKYNLSDTQLLKFYLESLKKMPGNIDLFILPETAFPNMRWVEDLHINSTLSNLNSWLLENDIASVISGSILNELYYGESSDPAGTKYIENTNQFYYTYNSSFLLNAKNNLLRYRHKKYLVPFEETIPFSSKLSFLQELIPSLGNFKFAYKETNSNVFEFKSGKYIGNLICFESLFFDLYREMSNKGVGLFSIILNEGWYYNTNLTGAKSFHKIAKIKAIEFRKPILRSSNQGISSTINQRGQVINLTSTNKNNLLLDNVNYNTKATFYSIFGDFLGLVSLILLPLILVKTKKIKTL